MREGGSSAIHTLQIGAAVVVAATLYLTSPASAQFVCTGDGITTDHVCTNSGTQNTFFPDGATGANRNATISNSETASGFEAQTTGGGNATATNSGSNNAANNPTSAGIFVETTSGSGNATATNSGSNAANFTNGAGIFAGADGSSGNATATNSGSNAANGLNGLGIEARSGSGNATATNSGSNTASGVGIEAETFQGGNATATNSGNNAVNGANGRGIEAIANGPGNATVTNSGSNAAANGKKSIGILAETVGSGNATVNNSGATTGIVELVAAGSGSSILTNSGVISNFGKIAVELLSGPDTMINIVGGRVMGAIDLAGTNNTINFVGGNWLFTVNTSGGPTTINTGGAPFVVGPTTKAGTPIAVLDATTFALADRSLTNFTGEISETLQGRFDGMSFGSGGGALGFAPASASPIADQAQAAFSGIPSVAMSYASDASRPVFKAPVPAARYYDTTIWASGFGGERHQRADGLILPTDDWAFGGAMGVDRVFGPNLRLGAFVGAGASREQVELDVQKIDATYVFGGAYGRFDWVSQYLDFALYGGGLDNKSTRQIANNTVPSGLEIATASYGGWFISPEITYGYRLPFNLVTVTPRLRLRYVGGALDGYSETGSMQNLSVGRRNINDLEERGEVEFSTVSGALKATATVGMIGLERLGNPTVNTVLLSQSLSFTTPGQANAVGGVLGMGLQYRALPNVKLFIAGEGIAMSDKSDSFAATGGAQVAF